MIDKSIFSALEKIAESMEYNVTNAEDEIRYSKERLKEMEDADCDKDGWQYRGEVERIRTSIALRDIWTAVYNDFYTNFQKYAKGVSTDVD